MTSTSESESLRRQLVERLVARGSIRSEPLRHAFLTIPREVFVPGVFARQGLAAVYADDALVTRWRRGRATSSSSQPSLMAEMLEQLDIAPGHRVLEIGLGTGYNAALIRRLVGPLGRVVSMDVDADVVAAAREAIGVVGAEVECVVGDGHLGWPSAAPYDRIIATAYSPAVPELWWHQLVADGVIVTPTRAAGRVGQWVVVLRRAGDRTEVRPICRVGFVALR